MRQQTLTSTLKFTYIEREFVPPYRIPVTSSTGNSFASAEQTAQLRANAMMNGDYELWLSTWDDDARAQFVEQMRKPGALEQQKQLWKSVFSVSRMVLFKRIETEDYIILTYRMLDQQGLNVARLELPSVFHKVAGKWLGTQKLANSILLQESPWMTGKDSVRREIK
jgi:hypothetical protein